MADKYCRIFFEELREQIENATKPLLDNKIKDIEQYRLISGKRLGLIDALDLAKSVYDRLYEVRDLSKFQSGEQEDEQRSREARSLY